MALPNLLSLNFLVPFVAAKIDFSRAIRGLRGMPRRLLLVGHKIAAGTAVLNSINTVTRHWKQPRVRWLARISVSGITRSSCVKARQSKTTMNPA